MTTHERAPGLLASVVHSRLVTLVASDILYLHHQCSTSVTAVLIRNVNHQTDVKTKNRQKHACASKIKDRRVFRMGTSIHAKTPKSRQRLVEYMYIHVNEPGRREKDEHYPKTYIISRGCCKVSGWCIQYTAGSTSFIMSHRAL